MDFAGERETMVTNQIAARGDFDRAVLDAMRAVPREKFVPDILASRAYDDRPLPIGEDQTISQPFVVAYMIEAAKIGKDSRVLEVGAGSGYAAAVIGQIAAQVFGMERHRTLAEAARNRMAELGYGNVHILDGDGSKGLPEEAPFDVIIVSAGGEDIPEALCDQLADGGRLVIPVGPHHLAQDLLKLTKRGDEFERESLGGVRFVPLVEG